MKNTILLFFFIFINFLNPISLYFTVAVNVVIFLISYKKYIFEEYSLYVVSIAAFIFLWALAVMFAQNSFNEYVFLKYLRSLISVFFIIIISNNLKDSLQKIIKILSIVLFSHILAIGLQVLFPILNLPMAFLFQFDRETEVITSMGIRNLGLTSSYDTASLISILSMTFFLVRFLYSQRNVYFILSLLSLMSTMRTSRTGMLIGVIIFIVLSTYSFLFKKQKSLFSALLFMTAGVYFLYNVVLPIIASTTDTFLSETSFNRLDNSNRDYTEGTVSGLTSGSHLNAIREISFLDLIFGRGIDPNEINNMATDIGYIKLIYHIGIVGLFSIFMIYFKLFFKCYSIVKDNINIEDKIISLFILCFIVILIIFNYKSLEIYSRGTHDLLLILFFLLVFSFKNRNIKTFTDFQSSVSDRIIKNSGNPIN